MSTLFTFLALLASVNSAPTSLSNFIKQDALAAQKLNAQFAAINLSDPCQDGQMACLNSSFAQCLQGQWNLTSCSFPHLSCYALPRGDKPGLSLVCDTSANALQRFVSAGLQGGITGTDNTTSTGSTAQNDPDDDDCDDDGTGTDPPPAGDDDDCDEQGDSTSSLTAAPISVTNTALSPLNSQANSTPLATATESPTPIMSATTITLQPRQIISFTSSSPSTSSPVASLALSPVLPLVNTSSASTPTSSSSPNGIVTPTVVIGTDNIVTVTVVSTVTLSATDCAAPQTAVTSSVGTSPTDAASTIVPSFGTSLFPSSPTSSAFTSTSFSASTPRFTSISSNSNAISSASATPISTSANGFSFFSGTPVTTPTPPATASGTLDISELLTATISS